MTDEAKPHQQLTTAGTKATDKSMPKRVTGKLKAALDLMIWEGTAWNDAAVKVNFRTRSMRMALGKPHVLKYLRAQRGIMLAQSSGQNLRRLGVLRDQDENRAAAVQAARTLEGLANEQFNDGPRGIGGGQRAGYLIDLSDDKPGLTIVIHEPARPPVAPGAGLTIDVTPNPKPKP